MSQSRTHAASTTRFDVLLVDDDADFAEMAGSFLERAEASISVRVLTDPERAVEAFEAGAFDAVLADYRMPGRNGLDLLEDIRELDPSIPYFLLTGQGSEAVASKAFSAGVTDYFMKEAGTDQFAEIASRIRRSVERRRLEGTVEDPLFETVFDGLRDGLLVVDSDLVVRRANDWIEARAESDPVGRKCYEVLEGREEPRENCPVRAALASGNRQRSEVEIRALGEPFWATVTTDSVAVGAAERALVHIRDVTERRRRQRELEKRERQLRALQDGSKSCLEASTQEELLEAVLEAVTDALSYSRVAVFAYDPSSGQLRQQETSPAFGSVFGETGPIGPEDTALWTPFQEDRTAILDASAVEPLIEGNPERDSDFLAVPLGDSGLLLIHRFGDEAFPAIDLEMLTLCGTTSTAILERIWSTGELDAATDTVVAQRDRIDDLEATMGSLRELLEIAGSADRAETERRVVSVLLETLDADFAWIARPTEASPDLRPALWDGREPGYLDAVSLLSDSEPLPGHRAASERTPIVVDRIAEHLQTDSWAKEALSMGFESAAAVPVEIDGVLYSVVSVYAAEPDHFDEARIDLLEALAALLAGQIRRQNLEQHNEAAAAVELEFSITDPDFALATIAARTGTPVAFEVLLESGTDSTRIICTLPEGAEEGFLEAARAVAMVREASWVSDQSSQTVVLELERPFIGEGVAVHGGRLIDAWADETGGRVTIEVPTPAQKRPLMEWFEATFREFEFVAKRSPSTGPARSTGALTETLTERQADVLEAAYAGGYFESPRKTTGGELADVLDISDSAVYSHLRAAEKRLLDQILDIGTEN